MKPITAICLVMLVAAPAPAFAEDMPYPDFGAIAKTPPASKVPAPATQPPIAQPSATQAPGSQASTKQTQETWRQLIARTPVPKAGCYTSAYPSTQWQAVPCSTAESRPHNVGDSGGSNDFSAIGGSLTSANGLFGNVTGVTQKIGSGRTELLFAATQHEHLQPRPVDTLR